MKKWIHTDSFILILMIIGVHIFYFPTAEAGFITDFTGLAERIETHGFSGILNCFDFPAMQQFLSAQYWVIYTFFGAKSKVWYLLFTTAHIANGFLFFQLSRRLFFHFKIENAHRLTLIAAFLFLFSPYASEPLTWRVCWNFLTVTFWILCALWQCVNFLEKRNRTSLLLTHVFFIFALFSFELGLTIPLIISSLLLIYLPINQQFIRPFSQLILPQVVAILAWFGLHKIVIGSWIGHYGAEVHLNTNATIIFANFINYFEKQLLLTRYWPHEWKAQIHIFNNHFWWLLLVGIIVAILLTRAIYNFKKLNSKTKLMWFCFGTFLLTLLPISNLFFSYLQYVENDRYGYLPSLFLLLWVVLFLSRLSRWLFYGLIGIYFIFSLKFLYKTNHFWQQSAEVYNSLLADFRWQHAPEVYILAEPENYKGIPIFRRFSRKSCAVCDALEYVEKKPVKGLVHEVIQFNMTNKGNGFSVEQDSLGAIKITFDQWGNWWWDRGIGATDYEKDNYQFFNKGHDGKIVITKPHPQAVFIYSDGDKWAIFDKKAQD